MIDTFVHKQYALYDWRIVLKIITSPRRKKDYPSHLALTVTPYDSAFWRFVASALGENE